MRRRTMETAKSFKLKYRERTKQILLIGFVALVLSSYSSPRRFLQAYHTVTTRDSSAENNHSIGKVFIAVNLYQSEILLRDGSWTRTMMELIDELEPSNVYLSIFENNSTDATPQLLQQFEKQVKCRHKIVTTKLNLDDDQYASLYVQNRTHRHLSRIAYLAMIRNRALAPISDDRFNISTDGSRRFSKVLFLNDIVFSSHDAIRLLQTNHGDYAAACGLDFHRSIKFYDTFATRDADGYSMGVRLYPYFSPGQSQSQMRQRDTLVHVKSCWSGMVAFDSKPFENGLKFRSLQNVPHYDASECCLIHADMNQPHRTYINPEIRVAYMKTVYIWQKRLADLESIWLPIQKFITYFAGLPEYNAHRTSANGGFCWVRGKMFLSQNHTS